MALSDVLNNLTGARDALVTAINNKGGTVATTATLRQCADAVTALPEGGGCDFYLCTSVGSGTWKGRKAVLTDGVYVFESTETTGLSYSAVRPEVGNIYSADALVTVSYVYGQMPQNGLKFYAPLKTSFVAETGQQLDNELCQNLESVLFQNVDGVPCAVFPNEGELSYVFYTGDYNFNSPLTISFWSKETSMDNCVILKRHRTTSTYNVHGAIYFDVTTTDVKITEASVSEFIKCQTTTGDIVHHYCYVQTSNNATLYKDRNIISSKSYSYRYTDGRVYLSLATGGGGCAMSSIRVYNRALSEDEVKILASEFSPVVGELFFTTTEADGKVEGGYMAAGTGTLKLQLATGEITELSLTDTMQRAFSAYELSSVRVVSGAESVTLLSINRIGIDYIDLSNFWSLEHLHMPISSSPEIKNLSSCHRLNYVDVGDSALSSAQVDQILSDILASNSHLNSESFSGSIDVSQNAVPTAAGLETIAQLKSVGWSVNYDRE